MKKYTLKLTRKSVKVWAIKKVSNKLCKNEKSNKLI
jgi:hypothetical protein